MDPQLAVFDSTSPDFILYKQILDEDTVKDIREALRQHESHYVSNDSSLVTRRRMESSHMDNSILDCIIARVQTTLYNYWHTVNIGTIRFYKQEFGETKPHRDVSTDGRSNYTLLIYLTDDFDGGRLRLRRVECQGSIEIRPIAGFGVLFSKDKMHRATELYGTKELILIDLEVR